MAPQRKCWLCGRLFEATRRGGAQQKMRACPRPKCQHVRWVIYGIVRRMRLEERRSRSCRLCDAAPREGSPFCEKHYYRREPCRGCGQTRVRRHARTGLQRVFCDECRRDKKRRRNGRQASPGALLVADLIPSEEP